jgi:hypothetical protein
MKAYYFIAVVFLLIALPFVSVAQIPRILSYQGVLSDTSGMPKPDGSYTITFRLYDTITAGSSIWTENKILKTKNGLFHTTLGDKTPFDFSVTFSKPYYLSLQVGTEPEILERIPLTSVAYSFNAYNVTNVINGSGFSNFVVFKSSGTFTVPNGVTKIMVEGWGGGGGGGGSCLDPNGSVVGTGGGGGGGGYGKDIFIVTPGTNYTVTVGPGGYGGSLGGSGGKGGMTSFGYLISMDGGESGCQATWDNVRNHVLDGNGGNGGGNGSYGKASIGVSGGNGVTGSGGGTGGGGGMSGQAPGGGGLPNQAGANGRLIVWW